MGIIAPSVERIVGAESRDFLETPFKFPQRVGGIVMICGIELSPSTGS